MSAARPLRRRSLPWSHEGAPAQPWGTGAQRRRGQAMSAEVATHDGVAVLQLDRPQALNTLNAEMLGLIDARLDEVAASDARAGDRRQGR